MNLVEKALASTVLTAAVAFGGAAQAQQAPAAPSTSACTTLGQQKGVFEYPAARKAFQQEGSLACVFGYGAGGQFIPLNAYNLNDTRQANSYNRELSQAERTETQASQRDQRQAEAEQRRQEADARRNSPTRQLEEKVRDVRSIQRSVDQLQRIFK